jgi:hypothetical protein
LSTVPQQEASQPLSGIRDGAPRLSPQSGGTRAALADYGFATAEIDAPIESGAAFQA